MPKHSKIESSCPSVLAETIDVLMITYNRPDYTRLSLQRLLDTCDRSVRVWLWHNGNDRETLELVRSFLTHPSVHRFHHSPENKKLWEPTNWFWSSASGILLGKVDDDCLVTDGWLDALRAAHREAAELGVIGCWHFPLEDFVPEVANRKIREFTGGHQVLQNFWIGGSGYLMKRSCVDQMGLLRPKQTFSDYCIQLARRGWVNGWLYPLIPIEHMDNPRSRYTALKIDDDLRKRPPLSLALYQGGSTTIAAWTEGQRMMARRVQEASIDPADYAPWRIQLRKATGKVGRILKKLAAYPKLAKLSLRTR